MFLVLALATALAGQAAPRTIVVESDVVRVVCPVGATTRLVLPDAKRRLTVTPVPEIEVRGLRSRPRAEVAIRPDAPGRTTLDFEGDSQRLRIEVEAVASGATPADIEIRLDLPAGVPPAEASVPAARPGPNDSDATVAQVAAADPAADGPARIPGSASLVDLEDLVGATPQRLDRRVVVAGHPELRAETLQLGTRWIWAQLRLRGGAGREVASVTWHRGRESGAVAHWRSEADGKDLRITLQIPRGEGRTDVALQILGGARYDVPLNRPGLSDIKDRLF